MSTKKASSAPVTRGAKRKKVSQPQSDQAQPLTKKPKSHSSDAKSKAQDSEKIENARHGTVEKLPSVKDLASGEWPKRKAAFALIRAHLELRPAASPLLYDECLQLWRGLFVAVYMHDSKNAISVQNFLGEVADTFRIVASKESPGESSTSSMISGKDVSSDTPWLGVYNQAFWEIMRREWPKMDSHRMNKYLLLIRLVVRQLFKILFQPLFSDRTAGEVSGAQQKGHAVDASIAFSMSIMSTLKLYGPLSTTDHTIPNGLRLHLMDIMPDEAKAGYELAEAESDLSTDTQALPTSYINLGLLEIYEIIKTPVHLMARPDRGLQKHIRGRAKEAIAALEEQKKALLEQTTAATAAEDG